jgi:hypothetical protein
LPALIAALALPAAADAPKVAVIYSDWSNYAFRHEFDSHLKGLGWHFETFENKDIKTWIGRLGEFDLVISAAVGNYTHPQDMAPYADAWRAFLARGGGLWITDASYGSVLDLWTNKLWPDSPLGSAANAPHSSDAITCDGVHPLLHVPYELPELLRAKDGIWAHLVMKSTAWRSLVSCADGNSLAVTRDIGRGTILVTSYFSFASAGPLPVVTGVLENLWTRVQGARRGVAVTAFDTGPATPGPHQLRLDLTNTSDQATTFDVRLKLGATEGDIGGPVAPGAAARFDWPFRVTERGPQTLSAEIRSGDSVLLTLQRRFVVPPLIAFHLESRHAFPDTEAVAANWAVLPDADVPRAECHGEIAIDQQIVTRLAAADLDGAGKLPLDGVALGPHTVVFGLFRGDQPLGTMEVPLVRHPAPRVAVQRDGTTRVDGRPFFPFGFYHVSWSFTAEERLAALRAIAAGGFNTIHAGIKQIDEWDPFLDEAARLGVMVVTEFGTDTSAVVRRYRDKPAVLAWNPGDEPDGAHVDPFEMHERAERFKDLDATHPSYMTLCVPGTYGLYAHCADVIAPDPYPVPHAPLGTVYDNLSAAVREARRHGNTVWGVLQAFGYPQGPWRVPTGPEERAMTYLALLAGVKGIIYYTYTDGKDPHTFRMWDQPALWAGMTKLPAEIKALEPALLGASPTTLASGEAQVHAGRWTVGATSWLMVVNGDAAAAHAVTLPAPPGAATELFAATAGPLTVKDGKLTGRMPALGVSVWRFGP